MLKWEIADRKQHSLIEHLQETRKEFNEVNYENYPTETLYGFDIPDKVLFKDILKAATRIIKAVKKNEKIVIFGHDDVDGVTSTYLLFDFLGSIGSYSHYYYIPNRLTDHHGIKEKFIDNVKENGYNLVITVDSGISSLEGIAALNQLNCDVIITDHHIIPEAVPDAYAIVNPKQDDCPYPDKMLAGVGVVFFLISTISELISIEMPKKYIFWTAVGTIADKVPMLGVNRVICKVVFDNWQQIAQRPISLWSHYISNTGDYFEKNSLILNIAKLLSSGREADGENSALYFLLAPDYKKCEIIASLFKRKAEYESQMIEVRRILTSNILSSEDLFCLYEDDEEIIPFSLMGWTGNCLASIYKIPIIIIKEKEGKIVGEGKCPQTFDLIKAFTYCKEALLQYGGHSRAAGFVTEKDKYNTFKQLFAEYVDSVKEEVNKGRALQIDAEIDKEEINGLRNMISAFSPFGEGAKIPFFLAKKLNVKKCFNNPVFYTDKFIQADVAYDTVFSFRPDGRVSIIDVKQNN